jgi:hypothetical protein
MRRHYDFSGAVRGKYAGRVDTTDIRPLDSAATVQKYDASRKTTANHLEDCGIQPKRGEKRYSNLGRGRHEKVQSSSEGKASKSQLFVERRPEGDYAVRRPNSERASAVLPTQAEAIERARELNPGNPPLVERVRFTDRGIPDKWRKP